MQCVIIKILIIVDIVNKMLKLIDKYPLLMRFWLGNLLFIKISDPELIKVIYLFSEMIMIGRL